jgi:hypothetical protein
LKRYLGQSGNGFLLSAFEYNFLSRFKINLLFLFRNADNFNIEVIIPLPLSSGGIYHG